MKKLLTIILAVALILPAAALADDPYIVRHYTLHIDGVRANSSSGKGGSAVFDFDSFTADLYLTADLEHGYYMETTSASGIFLNSGMTQVRLVEVGGNLYLADGAGNNRPAKYDEAGDLWINYGRGFYRFQLVEPFSVYSDWK